MKKLFLSLTLLCFLSVSLLAKTERIDVVVHLKDGTTVEAMMKYNASNPWSYQKSISVFDKSLAEQKKIKRKEMTKYKAKDIKGYEANGKFYETKRVMIAGRGDYGSALKSMPNYAMIERIEQGPISIYKGYAYPPTVVSGVDFETVYKDIRANPEYFMVKESDPKKVKSMHSVNIEKWIKDAPETSDQFAKGEFGNMKRKKKGKIGNFIKGQIENENPNIIIRVVQSYNVEMGE